MALNKFKQNSSSAFEGDYFVGEGQNDLTLGVTFVS